MKKFMVGLTAIIAMAGLAPAAQAQESNPVKEVTGIAQCLPGNGGIFGYLAPLFLIPATIMGVGEDSIPAGMSSNVIPEDLYKKFSDNREVIAAGVAAAMGVAALVIPGTCGKDTSFINAISGGSSNSNNSSKEE